MNCVLTRKQRFTLQKLLELHQEFPDTKGFLASSLGYGGAPALRKIETSGLVLIDRIAENCFRYSLTEEGSKFLNGEGLPA